MREAVLLFDGERFWEAHEVIESLWRVAEGQEKTLLQGLILVCAAFVHVQKQEADVALGIARRSLPLLDWSAGTDYHGVDVTKLKHRLSRMVGQGVLAPFSL